MLKYFLAVLLGAVLTGCATMTYQLEGASGPVKWRVADKRIVRKIVGAGEGSRGMRDVYMFTLILQETQGTSIAFTQVEWTTSGIDIETGSANQSVQWALQPYGQLHLPFSFFTYCHPAFTPSECGDPTLAPRNDYVFTGTDDQGRPVRLAFGFWLPPNPRDEPPRPKTKPIPESPPRLASSTSRF